MMLDSLRISGDVRRFNLVLVCLILIAWGLLIAWQRSAYAEMLSHEAIEDSSLPSLLTLAAFLLSWFLMTVAMMLPGSLPLLNQSAGHHRNGMATNRQAGLIIGGYLLSWFLFGLLVYIGDSVLHRMAEVGGPLAAFSGLISPAIVMIAGLYQLTPLKRSFLMRCQPAQALLLPSHLEKSGIGDALQHGIRMGLFCLGSCWSLMLLMFAIGHNRLDWMLVLSGIMAAERLTPWGKRLAWLVGFVLIIWATFWMLGIPYSHP